ncbi:MAG: Xaa-Pro aminopeptidase [Marinobacter sp. T13-3]|nr:MAG: Xaa-Pro aminopeptidase [Marinobacter sp. T13-3]
MDFNAYRKALSPRFRGAECPFPEAEYHERLKQLRECMEAEELGAVLLTDPSDIFYLTGYGTFEVSVHVALVVTHDDLLLQVPSIEMGPALTTTRVENISGYRWESVEEVLEPLVETLNHGIQKVAVDAWHGSLRTGVLDGLRTRLPSVRFVPGNGLLKQIRVVKSPAELEYLRKSAQVTAKGLAAAREAVEPGMTDNDVAAVGARALIDAGSEFMSMQPIVTTGVRSSFIHCNHRRTRIEKGDPVFLEFGSAWYRYTAPMMQTVVAGGQPNEDMRRVHDGCRRIVDALLETVGPGVTFDQAAAAAEGALEPLADRVFFSGVFGYTVGAQFPPSWVEGSGFIARRGQIEFRENMVFHLPICLRVPGQWGIGCSETIVVTEKGAEPITRNPWAIGA